MKIERIHCVFTLLTEQSDLLFTSTHSTQPPSSFQAAGLLPLGRWHAATMCLVWIATFSRCDLLKLFAYALQTWIVIFYFLSRVGRHRDPHRSTLRWVSIAERSSAAHSFCLFWIFFFNIPTIFCRGNMLLVRNLETRSCKAGSIFGWGGEGHMVMLGNCAPERICTQSTAKSLTSGKSWRGTVPHPPPPLPHCRLHSSLRRSWLH